jgi:hypothetical protein
MLHLFQENKSYGVETIALILCLHVAVHHVPNKKGYSEVTVGDYVGIDQLHRVAQVAWVGTSGISG